MYILKFDIFMDDNLLHPENIPFILLIVLVSKSDKSNDSNEIQSEKI